MGGYLSLWPLALRRARSRWRTLLPLFIGAVLAVALASSTFIYGDAVRELGLETTLAERPREDLDIGLISYYAATSTAAYNTTKSEAEGAIDRNVAWFVEGRARAMEGSTFFVNASARAGAQLEITPETIAGTPEAKRDPRRRAYFFFQTGFLDQTELVAGQQPAIVRVAQDTQGKPTSEPEIPALIFEETAHRQNLAVGDRLLLAPHWEDVSTHTVARVAGVLRRKESSSRLWATDVQRYATRSQDDNFIPLYIPEESFISGLGGLFPKMLSDYSWALFVDPDKIDVQNVSRAQFGLERLSGQLRSRLRSFSEETALPRTLREFQTKDLFGRIPLLIVVMLILGIVAYFLLMVATVVAERQQGEVALLRSRGADGAQVATLYLWEALVIAIIAFFVGPLVAWGATAVAGYTPAFSGLTDGSALPVTLSANAYGMALAGAAIAFLAMLAPTIAASQMNPLRHRMGLARPAGMSFFTRYYLDIFIAIIAGLLYWELSQRGSLVTTSFAGEQKVDRALLAAPALFLLAAGLLLLRFFPPAMRVLGWVAANVRQAWLVLALWHLGRDPVPYTRPILLLMLAASVAMFAANFGGTVDRSYEHRALYRSGGDLLVQGFSMDRRGASQSFRERFAGVFQGRAVTPVYRAQAGQPELFSTTEFDLLAVDTKSFPQAAWYRGDFSGESLEGLMRMIETGAQPAGLPLPPDAERIGVWARSATPRRDVTLRVRIGDANTRYADFSLGGVGTSEWQYLETRIDSTNPQAATGFRPKPPLHVVSLTIRQGGGQTLQPGAVYLDDLQAISAAGQTTVLEPFDGTAGAAVFNDSATVSGDSFETSASVARTASGISGVFIWGGGSLASTRGLDFTAKALGEPLPVIASAGALKAVDLEQGDRIALSVGGHVVQARIAGRADYFPTLDPFGDGFLVTSLPGLLERLNASETFTDFQPGEVWVASGLSGAERDRLVQSLRGTVPGLRIQDRQAIEAELREDPLIAAGWKGILQVAFAAVAAVTLLGFAIYSFVQAQQRRIQFALLRGMGLSPMGVAGVVLVEQLVVIVAGLGLGSWLGLQLTDILMPYLGLTEEGSRVLPPFQAAINWPAIIAAYAVIAGMFVVATFGLAGFFSRVAIQRALRFGEA